MHRLNNIPKGVQYASRTRYTPPRTRHPYTAFLETSQIAPLIQLQWISSPNCPGPMVMM